MKRLVITIAAGLVVMATCTATPSHASSLEDPDAPPVVEWTLEGWSDPSDGREAVYVYAPEGACDAHLEGHVVVILFDCPTDTD